MTRDQDISTLLDQREELYRQLTHVWANFYDTQRALNVQYEKSRLLTAQRRWWPVRLLWRPLRLKVTGRHWRSRHYSETSYGRITYLRLGALVIELGRNDRLEADIQRVFRARPHDPAACHQTAERVVSELRARHTRAVAR